MGKSNEVSYIAFLRGINVGGHSVKMDALRLLFVDLKLNNVRSYIQSGNIFFTTVTSDSKALQDSIHEHLNSSLGFNVPVCLRTVSQVSKIIESNPFNGIEIQPETRFAILFLSQIVSIPFTLPYITPDGGYEVIGKTETELFIIWHLINGKPGNAYGLIEKTIRVPTTTRFWHTTEKILIAAKDLR